MLVGRRAEGDPVLIVVLFGEMKTGRAETGTLWVVQGQLNRNPDPAGDSDCPQVSGCSVLEVSMAPAHHGQGLEGRQQGSTEV